MANAPCVHVEIDPLASDFLELLRELGHMDDSGMDQLTGQLMREAAAKAPVTLADARRAAAIFLFEAQEKMRPEARDLLNSEWVRLFG